MLEFIIVRDNDEVGSRVAEDEFIGLIADYVEKELDKKIASRKIYQSKKLTRAEVVDMLDDAVHSAISITEKIARVRVKP